MGLDRRLTKLDREIESQNSSRWISRPPFWIRKPAPLGCSRRDFDRVRQARRRGQPCRWRTGGALKMVLQSRGSMQGNAGFLGFALENACA
jgi:plasmid replication initiation protein